MTKTESIGRSEAPPDEAVESEGAAAESSPAAGGEKTPTDKPVAAEPIPSSGSGGRRRIRGASIKLTTVLGALGGVLLLAAVIALGVYARAKAAEVDDIRQTQAQATKAEGVALDYATGAAKMDYRSLGEWRDRLTTGTTPELSDKLTKAATSMEQLIAPLQWSSTANPIAAKVRSVNGAKYAIDCFVSVFTKNTQAPEGIQSTAAYRLTLDESRNWIIEDVSGIGESVAPR